MNRCEISIKELTKTLARLTGFMAEIVRDASKPRRPAAAQALS